MIRNLIQRSDTQNRLVRALNIKERVAAPTLHDQVVPVIMVDDLTAETGFDVGTTLPCWGQGTAGPVAGQYSLVALSNPPTSGKLIQIKKLRIGATAGSNIRVGVQSEPPWGALTSIAFRDHRITGQPSGQILSQQQAAPSYITNIVQLYSAVTLYEILDLDVLLDPGFALILEEDAVNRVLTMNVWWLEQYINR